MNAYRQIAKVTAIALPFIALGIGLWQLTRDNKPKWDEQQATADVAGLESVFDAFMAQFHGDIAKAKFAFTIHCKSLREAYVKTHSYDPSLHEWLKHYDAEVKRVNKLNKHRR